MTAISSRRAVYCLFKSLEALLAEGPGIDISMTYTHRKTK
ncbi:MAG: hypothetical protein JWR21_1405 [Herminiimonas sp.]|nr:hypothetical protein [Herminiimonas sp.]MDB5852552.1 hypothetical protein [Herminiimonas sp.]